MARFDIEQYETVAERLARAHKDHPDLRVVTNLVEVARDEAKRPMQYIVQAQIWLGEILKAQDYAEEIVNASPVNRTSALENCATSAIGRALADMGYQGVDPRKTRPSREEMEKVVRYENKPQQPLKLVKQFTEEQIARVGKVINDIATLDSVDELRKIYNSETDFLDVKVDGTTIKDALNKRVKELGL
jgi:hypothetical protein